MTAPSDADMARADAEAARLATLAKADLDAMIALWAQAVTVSSVKLLVPITLDLQAGNYAQWRGLFEVALEKYALDDHLRAAATSSPDAQWLRLDALVRSWLYAAIMPELLAMVMDSAASAHTIWTRIEGLYCDNAETRAIYLEQEFYGLMQGSMTVANYCRKQRALADELTAVGTPIVDKSLVLNTLRGLSPRLAHMRTLISMQRPVPSFLETRSALLLEELTAPTESSGGSLTPSAFVTTSGANSSTGSSGGSSSNTAGTGQNRTTATNSGSSNRNNNRRCNNGGGGNHGSCGGGQGANRGGANPSAQGSAPWPSLQNPWAGSIQMWPGQGVLGSRPGAFTATVPAQAPSPGVQWPTAPGTQWPGMTAPSAQYAYVPPASWDQQQLMHAFNTMQLNPPSSDWLMDSGASAHMTSDQGSRTVPCTVLFSL